MSRSDTTLARTVGIDLAATAKGTAVVAIDWTVDRTGDGASAAATVHGRAGLVHDAADGSADTEAVLDALEDGHKVGVDCPFGWPSLFVAAVAAHATRGPWPAGPEPADRRELRLRATDRHVAEQHGLHPLAVSADRIGAVAMRWAALLDRHERERGHGPVDRAGRGRLVEVYPALAAQRWGLSTPQTSGYKGNDHDAVLARRTLLNTLLGPGESGLNLVLDETLVAAVEHPACGDDVVDALIAALIAAAACTPNGIEPPPTPDAPYGQLASHEGWIVVPTTPLGRIAPLL